MKIIWPKEPKLWEFFEYSDPFGSGDIVVFQWCGVAGWSYRGVR